jgi:hypothetical protein
MRENDGNDGECLQVLNRKCQMTVISQGTAIKSQRALSAQVKAVKNGTLP